MEERNKSKTLLDTSILIAAISALTYFLSFIYEAANYRTYDIPQYLIEQTTFSITDFGIHFLMYGLFYVGSSLFTLDILTRLCYLHPSDSQRRFLLYTVYKSIVLWAVNYFFNIDISFILYFLLFVGADFLWATIIVILSAKGYFEKSKTETQTKTFITRTFTTSMTTIYIIIVLIAGSMIAGNDKAKNQTHYFVMGKAENILVIAKNNDNLICKPYNKKTNQLIDSVLIYKINDREPVALKYKYIGRLIFP